MYRYRYIYIYIYRERERDLAAGREVLLRIGSLTTGTATACGSPVYLGPEGSLSSARVDYGSLIRLGYVISLYAKLYTILHDIVVQSIISYISCVLYYIIMDVSTWHQRSRGGCNVIPTTYASYESLNINDISIPSSSVVLCFN